VELVERAPLRIHQRVLLPRLRDHHHHRVRDRIAGHHQQLEAVVERGGVGLPGVDDRVQLLQVVAQHRRAHHAFTRAQPVVVALDGVDLAVVRDHPVRVRQRPLGEGVGGEALVHQGERRHEAGVLEVAVVLPDLAAQQQALVDDRARRHRRHEVLLAVLQVQRLDGVAGHLADHVQLALERVGDHDVGTAADEDLPDHGLLGLHRRRHLHRVVDRHVAPAEQHLVLGTHRSLELLLAGQAGRVLLRQEHDAHAVFAGGRQRDALLRHLLAEELVRDLREDARAVAHQRVGTDGAPVVEVAQDLETLLDDLVALLALDVGDEADTAGVVLELRPVQPRGVCVPQRNIGGGFGLRTDGLKRRGVHRSTPEFHYNTWLISVHSRREPRAD